MRARPIVTSGPALHGRAAVILSVILSMTALAAGPPGTGDAAGAVAYVPFSTAGRIAVIDAARDALTGTIDGVGNVHALAITPDGRLLLAGTVDGHGGDPRERPANMPRAGHGGPHRERGTAPSGAAAAGHVLIIDTRQRRALRRVTVPGMVHHITMLPDGRHAVAAHTAQGTISVIDVARGRVTRTVPTGPAPNYVVASGDGRRVYVSNAGGNTVSEIDTARWRVLRDLPVGKAPEHLALSADGSRLYVTEAGAGTVAELDTVSGLVLRRFAVGRVPHGVALTADGRRLIATARDSDQVVAVDLATGERREARIAPAPFHVAAVGAGKAYITSRRAPVVWVLDTGSLKVLREIRLPRGVGHQIAVFPGG